MRFNQLAVNPLCGRNSVTLIEKPKPVVVRDVDTVSSGQLRKCEFEDAYNHRKTVKKAPKPGARLVAQYMKHERKRKRDDRINSAIDAVAESMCDITIFDPTRPPVRNDD